jgi:hypothetical protein
LLASNRHEVFGGFRSNVTHWRAYGAVSGLGVVRPRSLLADVDRWLDASLVRGARDHLNTPERFIANFQAVKLMPRHLTGSPPSAGAIVQTTKSSAPMQYGARAAA